MVCGTARPFFDSRAPLRGALQRLRLVMPRTVSQRSFRSEVT